MNPNAAKTPKEYLNSLPPERREALAKLRQVVVDNLPPGYEEVMNWGMICYQVPLSVKPDTYNGQPLCYIALASQKNHMAAYLTAPYSSPELLERLQNGFKLAGKKLDMGKSCVRFKQLEDLALPVIAESVAAVPMKDFVEVYEAARAPKSS